MANSLTLNVGTKTDPIEYRYSFEWLFKLLAEENIHHVQLGTFLEIYHLPDEWFIELKNKADSFGVNISSIFTSHRELGGVFRRNSEWQQVAAKNFQRLIQIGSIVGAKTVGSNPGAVVRDDFGFKAGGMQCYLDNMKQLMHIGCQEDIKFLTIEPMSCSAEPPATPNEIELIAKELFSYHKVNLTSTCSMGYCVDTAHGFTNDQMIVTCDNLTLIEAALPYMVEMHLKNTDRIYENCFGFTPRERRYGIVDIARIRNLLIKNADLIPQEEIIGYLEIPGPKLGRDYSDCQLEGDLRKSLQYLKENFIFSVTKSPLLAQPVLIKQSEKYEKIHAPINTETAKEIL